MRIPDFLKSTYIMLFETFPNGICEEYYWIILYLLYDYMADENLALVMSYFIDKPCPDQLCIRKTQLVEILYTRKVVQTSYSVSGLYLNSGEKIVKAELGNYDVFDFSNRTMYSYDVKLTNMLDVSNPAVRSQLGISLDSIVGESYDVTHAIGRYAYSNGYNGIIAPSARADGGVNIILFNTKGVK